jgi:superfamily II DNA or RNA helicase
MSIYQLLFPQQCVISSFQYSDNAIEQDVFDISVQDTHCFFADGLLVHNCHNFGGMKFFHTARKFKAPYRYGLSGTAFRNDDAGMLLNALCGDIISKIKTTELVEKGVVYRTKIMMHFLDFRLPIPVTSRNWREIYSAGIVYNEQRNRIIVKWARRLRKNKYTVLILVKEIEHGNILKAMLSQYMLNVQFMNGQETAQNREDVLRRFCKGCIPVLIGTKIYNEGIDFVGLTNDDIKGKSVIFAGGGKSKIESIQMAARPTTREAKEGMHEEALIIDFFDSFQNQLLKHSLERRRTYKNIGEFDVSTVHEIPSFSC